jgi:ribosomal protein S18 acetylase RimI-like enzyme
MPPPPLYLERGDYAISTDPARFDLAALHAYLSRAYWSQGIPRETIAKALQGSLNFGLFHRGQQIGLARVITDEATYAYLCDVYVLEEHRGQGLAKWLLEAVMAHPSLQGLRRFMLVTRDAQGLYSQFGFRVAARPEGVMEIVRPNIYLEEARP